MSIRVATIEDLPRILDMGEQLHHESPRWSRLTFSRSRLEAAMRNLITDPRGVIFLAEREGEVVGGIAAFADQHWSCEDVIATEMSLFVAAEARGGMGAVRLICALKAWAQLIGAKLLVAGTSTGVDPEQTAKLYECLGFTRCSIGLEVACALDLK